MVATRKHNTQLRLRYIDKVIEAYENHGAPAEVAARIEILAAAIRYDQRARRRIAYHNRRARG